MATAIHERVSVIALCPGSGRAVPVKVQWRGRVYHITQLGHHHTVRQGRTLFHVFSVISGGSALRLRMDTETLVWELEEIDSSLCSE